MIIRFFRWLAESPSNHTPPNPKKQAVAVPVPPPPTKPRYQPPSGKELRLLLHDKSYKRLDATVYRFMIDEREYRVAYVFTHSAWYSIAFVLNKMRLPSLVFFTRGRQPRNEMLDLVKEALFKKKKRKLVEALKQRRAN